MNAINKLRLFACLLAVAGLTVLASCSKDRLDKTTSNDYAPLDAFYNDNAPPEQTFTIDSLGGDTITGMDGTHIWGIPRTIFMLKSTHADIYYPYTLKLIEAYSMKNMILSKLPNVAQTKVLESAGEIKVTAFKNSDELMLKQNCGLSMAAPDSTPDAAMKVYYGFTNSTTDDWNMDVTQTDYIFPTDTVTHIAAAGNYYWMKIAKLGWTSIAHTFAYTNSNITFTATGTNTNYIDVYIIFKNKHSFVKVDNLAAQNMPDGEPITVFAIAEDSGGTMYYFMQDYTISNGLQVDLLMNSSTESQILTLMAGF